MDVFGDTRKTFENRPWGTFTVLDEGPGYKVKRIAVKPHHRLSLQSHKHRSEDWVVVSGKGTFTVGDQIIDYEKGARPCSIYAGQKHRMENKTDEWLIVIEVQTGTSTDEEDITRYEDDYGRKQDG